MSLLFEGMKIGLVLAIMTGPILFALVQTGVEEGVSAGLIVCLGIWISDFLFITGVSYALAYAVDFSPEGGDYRLYIGIIGGIILIVFGLGNMWSKPPNVDYKANEIKRSSSWGALWMKGFLINTINPFTVVFWFGIASTIAVRNELTWSNAILFFGGIMSIVILTDYLKVKFSHKIRHQMKPKHIIWLRLLSGAALVLFGIVMMVRVIVDF